MKKLMLFLFIAVFVVIFVVIFIDVFEKSTRRTVDNNENKVEKENTQILTNKQRLLELMSPENKALIQKIDSIEFLLAPTLFVHNSFSIQKKQGETWAVSTPYKNRWEDRIYNEESGELLGTLTHESYLGKAYLEKIQKRAVWTRHLHNGEDDYCLKNSFMEYGVLLSTDTVAGKIFPIGTFVVSHFQDEGAYERNQIFYEYIEDYDKFKETVWKNLETVYDWPEWVNGYSLQNVIIWL